MRASIDRAGRLTVPKALRDVLGFMVGTEFELHAVDRRLEVSVASRTRVADGPNGVRFEADPADALTPQTVRDLAEQSRR